MNDASPHPSASSPGRALSAFGREADMHEHIARVADALVVGLSEHRATELHVLFEVPAAAGIPDVLCVAFHRDEISRRTGLGLAPVLDVTAVRLLSAVADGPRDMAHLARAAQVTADHLRRSVIPKLQAAGWLETLTGRGDRAIVSARVPYASVGAAVVTVEAKRRDWKGALAQARQHLRCADRAFVGIDAATPGPLLGLAGELARSGIGLLTVDARTADTRVVALPSPRQPRVDEHAVVAERAWSLVLEGRTTWETFRVFGRDLTASRR